MTVTTTSEASIGSATTNVVLQAKALMSAQPQIVFDNFGLQSKMPKNKKLTMQWRRVVPFTANTTPLQEGVMPTARVFAYQKVTATLAQYGELVIITDVVDETSEYPVFSDASIEVGANVGRSKEQLTYAVLKAGTNIVYNNGSARTDVNTPPTLNKLRSCIQALDNQKATPVTKMLEPSTEYGTRGIEPGYIAFCHTNMKADIRNLAGFTPVVEYGSRKPIHPREFGSVEEVRFITSADLSPFASGGGTKAGSGTTMISTDGTSADVYPIIIIAEEAFGTVSLRGEDAMALYTVPVGKPDSGNRLGQQGSVGSKFWHAAVRLNELWMLRWECAATLI